MKPRALSLDVIDVRTPCTASWEQMQGDDRSRFCTTCQKHVHNLSAFHSTEAERLVSNTSQHVCVRFERAEDGRVVTLDRKRSNVVWNRWLARLFGTVAAVMAGCTEAKETKVVMGSPPPATQPSSTQPTNSERVMIMGEVCIPATTRPTTAPVPKMGGIAPPAEKVTAPATRPS